MLKGSRKDASLPQAAARRYGDDIVALFQRYRQGDLDYLARCKRACLLGDWIDGAPVEAIEKQYTANPFRGAIGHGDIRRFADNTRRHLRTAHEVASLMFIEHGADPESIETLLKRLEVGVPAEAVGLLESSVSLTRAEYLALHRAGVRTAEQLRTASE